jgi:OmpA-OmpF porin, OOP family
MRAAPRRALLEVKERQLHIRIASWLGGACLLLATSAAWAVDPLGFYVGAGVGDSTLQSNSAPFIPTSVEQHPTGWKLFGGWRPTGMFGAEAEYVDFGSKSGSSGSSSQQASGDAVAAFLVGYLPVPLPMLDVYGKVGLGNVHRNFSNTPGNGVAPVGLNDSSTVFAYAAGVQVKFGAPAVRLEYQGFTTSGGDQALLSLDFAWNF